jgi:recombination protein RecT
MSNAPAPAQTTGKEPAKKDAIMTMLSNNWPTIKNVIPRHLTPERMARIAYTAISTSPALASCHPMSLANAVIEASMLGLEIGGPLGMAHLLPFGGKATLVIGYKGFMDLAYRSGIVSNFSAQPVYENDFFEYAYGLHPKLEHRPAEGDRGKLRYAYAVAHYKGGGYDFEVVTPADIVATKKRSSGAKKNDSPWNQADLEWTMWVKTAIRRLAKRIPQSPDIQRAAALDETADVGKQELHHIIDIQPTTADQVDDLNAQVMGKA